MSTSTILIIALLIGGISAKVAAYVFFRQSRRLQRILEHSIEAMGEGFVLYDDKDRLVMWNERARRLHASNMQDVRPGTDFETILRGEVAAGHFLEAEGQEEAWIARRLEGHRKARSLPEDCLSNGRCIRITKDRTPDGYLVSVIVDVTEIRNAQRAAEAGNQAKSDVLKNISHELRTPLTVIFGHARLLGRIESMPASAPLRASISASEATSPEAPKAMQQCFSNVVYQSQRIESASQHLLNLVNEVLDLARLEEGKVDLEVRPIAVEKDLGEAVEDFRQAVSEKGLELSYSWQAEVIHADPHRLKQILYNLLGNALKFTDRGSIRVEVTPRDDGTCLSVEDTGLGIAEDQLERIFESFHQVDASDARTQKGTGLGLALTKALVEQHGGTIRVESTLGSGSRFEIFLPALAVATAEGEEAASADLLPA